MQILKHFLFLVCTVCGVPLFSQLTFPEIIEIDQFANALEPYAAKMDPEVWVEGGAAFNQSPELIPFFAYLTDNYKIDVIVETGTWKGDTTALFAFLCSEVHTAEVLHNHYEIAIHRLSAFPNAHCHLGSSPEVLNTILPAFKNKRVLFYLDAHWGAYWPLRDELAAIRKTHKNNCIIVIDDIQVPNRPDIPYDGYAGKACSYKYVKKQLDEVFSSYTIHYLIPRNVVQRAKLVVIPSNF